MFSHIVTKPDFWFFVTRKSFDPKYRLTAGDSIFWVKIFSSYKKSKIGLGNYVRNHVIFHLKPVPSKNIEKWRLRVNFRDRVRRKNHIHVCGESPVTEEISPYFALFIYTQHPHHPFSTYLGWIGCKMKVVDQVKHGCREYRETLCARPLKQQTDRVTLRLTEAATVWQA